MSEVSRLMADFDVAGMRYWDGSTVIGKLKPGKRLQLVAEPDNPYDPNAIAIYRKGVKLGHIPRTQNGVFAKLFHFGHGNVIECRVISLDKKADPAHQVHVGVYMTDARKPSED